MCAFFRNCCYLLLGLTILSCKHPANRILVVIRGDSYCTGIGSSGTSSSASYYAGRQVQGRATWAKQLQSKLNQNTSGKIFVVNMEGYPGQTAGWFANGDEGNKHFSNVKDYIEDNLSRYELIIFSAPFGINESGCISVEGPIMTDTLINNIRQISNGILGISNRIKIIGYPVPRRADRFAKPLTNEFRIAYNKRIRQDPRIIGATSIINYDQYPQMYSDRAPFTKYFNQNDVDGLKGVHPSDLGYQILAEMFAQEIIRISDSSTSPASH